MKAWTLTIMLAGLAMLGPFATDTFLPSFHAISTHFNVSYLLVQQTLSVYLAAYAFMTLFYGTLSDSFGRRPVILYSMFVFAAGSIGAAFAPSFGWLLFFRGVQGASVGAGRVIGQAIVRDTLTGAAAQKMLANIMMVFGIAPAIAPIIGGWLHVAYGWQSTFVFTFIATVLLLLISWRGLPESLPLAQRQPFHPSTIAANYWQALRHRGFQLRSLAVACAYGGFALYIASAPHFVMELLHLPETAFGWMFVPMVGGLVAGSALNGKLAHTVPMPQLVRRGLLIMAATALCNIGYNHWFVPSIPWAIIPIMTYAFGMSLALPGMTISTLDIFPQMRGLAASLQNFVQMLLFALVSGFVAPLLFDSSIKLALGQMSAVLLASLFWWLASQKNTARSAGKAATVA